MGQASGGDKPTRRLNFLKVTGGWINFKGGGGVQKPSIPLNNLLYTRRKQELEKGEARSRSRERGEVKKILAS